MAVLPRYRGVFPVVPTIFDPDGSLDLQGQKRCVDFMIDAGSNGLCMLANFFEQFALSGSPTMNGWRCTHAPAAFWQSPGRRQSARRSAGTALRPVIDRLGTVSHHAELALLRADTLQTRSRASYPTNRSRPTP